MMNFYSIPSSWTGLLLGLLFSIRFALTLMRITDNRWVKCLITSDSSAPVCLARELPILFTSLTVDSPQAPNVSIGNGVNVMPAVLHASPCLVIFRS